MIAITLLLLPIFIYMTVKVSRMVWRNEKAVPLMFIILCVTLLSMVVFYAFLIVSMKNPEGWCHATPKYMCMQSYIDNMPSICLANAVILNLNKWVYFMLRISAFIKVGCGEDDERVDTNSDESESNKEKKL